MASSNANIAIPVSFPFPPTERSNGTTNTSAGVQRRSRTSSSASAASRIRAASIKLMEAAPPPGMWAATGSVAARVPTLTELRDGSFGPSGWSEEPQRQRRVNTGEMATIVTSSNENAAANGSAPPSSVSPREQSREAFPPLAEEDVNARASHGRAPLTDTATSMSNGKDKRAGLEPTSKGEPQLTSEKAPQQAPETKPQVDEAQHPAPLTLTLHQYSNGYVPPPKVPWTRTTAIALKAFSKWVLTPWGALITIYGLNVVAWGGMLFLLLCNAAPAMCNPSCDDIMSPRRIWIEIDSQILNALFCVTGFGLAPWRFRDLYWWVFWRFGNEDRSKAAIRRLAGIHRGWYRLRGSDALPAHTTAKNVPPDHPAVPIPVEKMPDPPPMGLHAPPTKTWKMDFVLWNNAANTFFQVVLCFYMWHYDRFTRPSWATGLFVACGCVVAGLGGIMIWYEGKRIKKVEGLPAPRGLENNELEKGVARADGGGVKSTAAPAEAPKSS